MASEGWTSSAGLRIISAIAIGRSGLPLLGSLVLVVLSFGNTAIAGALFAGVIAIIAGSLLGWAAQGLPLLSNPSRRRLLGLGGWC